MTEWLNLVLYGPQANKGFYILKVFWKLIKKNMWQKLYVNHKAKNIYYMAFCLEKRCQPMP